MSPLTTKCRQTRQEPIPIVGQELAFVALVQELMATRPLDTAAYHRIMRQHARAGVPWLSKYHLLHVHEQLCADGWSPSTLMCRSTCK